MKIKKITIFGRSEVMIWVARLNFKHLSKNLFPSKNIKIKIKFKMS